MHLQKHSYNYYSYINIKIFILICFTSYYDQVSHSVFNFSKQIFDKSSVYRVQSISDETTYMR